jgi:hypothetical protein
MKARDAVSGFMKSWAKNDFEAMRDYCVKQWHRESADDQLENIFSERKIKAFKVGTANNKGYGLAEVPVSIEFENGFSGHAVAICMCEGSEPYKLNLNGQWGVNVASLLTMEKANVGS